MGNAAKLLNFLFAFIVFSSIPLGANAAFTYSGRLFNPDGDVYSNQTLEVRAEVRAGSCYLYRYEKSTTTDDEGHFSISLTENPGSSGFAAGSQQEIFSTTSANSLTCFDVDGNSSGSTFAPNSTELRQVHILVKVAGSFEEVDSQTLTPYYQSKDSSKLGGRNASEFLYSVNNTSNELTQNNLQSVFATGATTKLLALINGTSTSYEKSGELGGKSLPTLANGQSIRRNGSGAWETFTPLSASDPLSLTSGTIGGSTVITTSGAITSSGAITTSSLVSASGVNTRSVTIYDSDNSNYVSILTPATNLLTTNLTLTLPAATGSSGQVLGTSGSGVLTWVNNGIVGGSGSVTLVSAGTGLTSLPAAGITGAGTLSIATGGIDTVHLKDSAVTGAKLEAITGLTSGTYGTASKVPQVQVDSKGRVVSASEVAITGLLPATSNGKFLKSGASAWSPEYITVSDLKTSTGGPAFTSSSCTTSQTLNWSSLTDTFACQNIAGLSASVLTSGTLDLARLPASVIYWQQVTGGIGYSGTTSSVELRGNTPVAIAAKGMIDILPYGTSTGNSGSLRLLELAANGTNAIRLRAPDNLPTDQILTLPVSSGAANTVMVNDGSGNLSWAAFNASFPLLAPTGVPSSPQYSFSGDENTGLFSNSDNTLGLAVNGVEKLRVSTGGVGIGTVSPVRDLDIVGNNSAEVSIGVYNAGASGRSGIFLGHLSANYAGLYVGGGTSVDPNMTSLYSSVPFRVRMGSSSKLAMYVDTSGNIGIKNNSPQYDLDVGSDTAGVSGSVRALNFISTSDARLKTHIQPMPGLEAVRRLRGVKYNWIQSGAPDGGFLAQEVEQVLPDAVRTDSQGYKGVKYQYILAPLVESVKELDLRCEELSTRLEKLEAENERLRLENEKLEERLQRLERAAGLAQ